jgi:hypothetical protein
MQGLTWGLDEKDSAEVKIFGPERKKTDRKEKRVFWSGDPRATARVEEGRGETDGGARKRSKERRKQKAMEEAARKAVEEASSKAEKKEKGIGGEKKDAEGGDSKDGSANKDENKEAYGRRKSGKKKDLMRPDIILERKSSIMEEEVNNIPPGNNTSSEGKDQDKKITAEAREDKDMQTATTEKPNTAKKATPWIRRFSMERETKMNEAGFESEEQLLDNENEEIMKRRAEKALEIEMEKQRKIAQVQEARRRAAEEAELRELAKKKPAESGGEKVKVEGESETVRNVVAESVPQSVVTPPQSLLPAETVTSGPVPQEQASPTIPETKSLPVEEDPTLPPLEPPPPAEWKLRRLQSDPRLKPPSYEDEATGAPLTRTSQAPAWSRTRFHFVAPTDRVF